MGAKIPCLSFSVLITILTISCGPGNEEAKTPNLDRLAARIDPWAGVC